MDNLRILILAAGKGTRMKSAKAKVLHEVAGAALVQHVLRNAQPVSNDIAVVVGHQSDKVKALLPGIRFADQTEQLGTGHAVLAASSLLSGFDGDLLVMPGDVPLVSEATLRRFVQFHREGGFRASVLTADAENPFGYGRIIRLNDHEIDEIVEHRDATPDVLAIPEINSSIYVFHTPTLFEALADVRNENSQAEYYLTDVIGILARRKLRVGAYKVADSKEILGINTRQELASVERILRERKSDALMSAGVTLLDPSSTFVDVGVEIAPDTVIHPFVQIQGNSVIGGDVTVRSFSRITSCRIGARTTILEGCILVDSEIGDDVSVGPYAHLRMGARLDHTVKVGNFVEIKKSSLGRGTKSMHLAYVGDATVGRNVNIGAGVITVNYDGANKHATHIEDDAFIGSDCTLIAPVVVEAGAFVAAGSTITDNVPAGSLAIARGRQVVKPGRAPHRKKK